MCAEHGSAWSFYGAPVVQVLAGPRSLPSDRNTLEHKCVPDTLTIPERMSDSWDFTQRRTSTANQTGDDEEKILRVGFWIFTGSVRLIVVHRFAPLFTYSLVVVLSLRFTVVFFHDSRRLCMGTTKRLFLF
jgi:hypothetical protein